MPSQSGKGLTVAVTGASGYIATRLIASLDADPDVARILGFDLRPPAIHPRKLVFDTVDIRDPALKARLAGVDIVVHLAFVMDPMRDEAEMRDVNVNGSQNVFRSAAHAGVPKIVYASSATVYGAHPDNAVPLTEESPLRANLDFSYPAHKLEVEYLIREVREEFPDLTFTVLRPAVVFGAHVDNAWSHLLELPIQFAVRGHHPPLQFVHEDDVTLALRFAILNDLEGAFNLAPADWTEWEEVVELVGRRVVELTEPTVFSLQDRLWSLGLGEAPPGMLHYVMHPWVVAPDKLSDAGFTCLHSSSDALRATLARTDKRVRLGRSSVPKDALRTGAIAGAGAVSGLVLLRSLRKRRKKAALIG